MLSAADPEALLWASLALWCVVGVHRRYAGRSALAAAFGALIAHASLRRVSPSPAIGALVSGLSLLVARVRARRAPATATHAPLLLAILMLCAAYTAVNELKLRTAHPPAGQFVRLDASHRLHVICDEGAPGSPIVLLDAGLPCTSASWRLVRDAARANASLTLCAFDRAGYGWSDRRAGRRDAATLADEAAALLGQLLAARGQRRVVLVGWSFGAYTSAVLAARHPALVAALVLVDGSTPHATADADFAALLLTGQLSFSLMRLLLPLGACRVAEQLGLLPRDAGAPPPALAPAARAEVAAHACWPGFAAAAAEELFAWRESEAHVAAALPALARRPLVVLAARAEGAASLANQRALARHGAKDATMCVPRACLESIHASREHTHYIETYTNSAVTALTAASASWRRTAITTFRSTRPERLSRRSTAPSPCCPPPPPRR